MDSDEGVRYLLARGNFVQGLESQMVVAEAQRRCNDFNLK